VSAPLHAVRVRVPASTSNLGAGFDCVGLALDRCLTASFEPGGTTLRIERGGTLAALATVGDDLLLSTFRDRLDPAFGPPAGVLRVESEIPVSRGLGSSAAAVVAGLLLADSAAGRNPDRDALLSAATAVEGHPDNAAPALFGGLVVVARDGGGEPRVLRYPVSPEIGFAFAAPDATVATAVARRALPAIVPHELAVRALPRLPALLRGLERADPALLAIGFGDELHVPYRLPLIPGGVEAIAAAGNAGAWAATISGSGSGIIAVAPLAAAAAVRDAMLDVFRARGGATGFLCEPSAGGAELL
jgi:homoserine kinase